MTVKDYIFFTKHHAYRKILKYKLSIAVNPSKKVPDLNSEVQDLVLEAVDLKEEVPDLRSGGIPHPNFTSASPITSFAQTLLRSQVTANLHTANDLLCLRMSVISCVLNAHSGRYADALISYTAHLMTADISVKLRSHHMN